MVSTAVDTNLPDIETLNRMIKQYAPIIYFHSGEEYLMTSVECYLEGLEGIVQKIMPDQGGPLFLPVPF